MEKYLDIYFWEENKMKKHKISNKLLSILLTLLIIVSSFPISSIYAATKETEQCVNCSGIGTVACTDCVGGYKSTVCTICSGTGLFEENPCEACDGTGKEKCETCIATGFVVCSICNGTGEIEVEYEICPVCNGDKKCTTCAGEGAVKIPCSNSVCNNGKIDVDCPDCEDGKIEVSCSNCSGTGNVSKIVSTPCATCGGTGLLADDSDCPDCEDGMVESLQDVDCDQCVAGKIEQDCSTCGGVGTIQQNCTVCGGTGEIDSVCHDCSGDKKCANCLGTGKIKTVADTSFDFNEATPSNIKVGDIFENIASSSNNTTGTVSYEVDDDTIAVITNDGKLTAKRVGTVTVTAKIVTDYTFSSAETTYTITIDKATPVISGISATAITYGQKLSDSTVSAVAKVGTTEISGRFAWADSVKNEEPTVVTDSDNTEYEAVFTPDDTDNYTTATFKAKVTVKKANITGITVKGCNHVYDGNAVDAVSVSGLEASDTVKYSIDNGNTYQTSMPKLTNVNDSKTVYVSVTRDGNYNDYVTGVPAVVSPAKIDGVSFNVYSGTYDGEEHPAVTLSGPGYKESDTVTYKYNGNSYSELNFKEEGRYEVEVIISRTDNNYKETKFPDETDVKFVVDITKADVTVKANDVTKEYTGSELPSEEDKSISVSGNLVERHNVTAKVNGSGTTVGKYILTPSDIVIRDAEGNDVTKNYNISKENGILDITKRPLKITANNVNATYNAKPYNSNVFYEKLEDRYSQEGLVEGQTIVALTIDGEKTAVDSYSGLLVPSGAVIKSGDEETTSNYDIEYVSGDITIGYLEIADVNDVYTVNDANDFGWYNDKVILTAKDGYKLCYSNDNADSFIDYVEYTTEGVTNPKVAVMEIATGYITDILDCNQVKIDTVQPNVFDIEYKPAEAYKKILETVTFGIYKAPTVATIYASDATSNIKSVSYKLTGAGYVDVDVADMTFDEGKYSYDIVIPASFKGQVQYYATDNSGLNSEIKSDDNGIIVDVTAPLIESIRYNDGEKARTEDGVTKHYYSSDAKVEFKIDEEYFFEKYYETSEEAKAESENYISALKNDTTLKITKNDSFVYYEGSAVPDEENAGLFTAEFNESERIISVTIPSANNDGDYVIELKYADPAGNPVKVETDIVVIDTTKPVITAEYNTPYRTVSKDGKEISYYNDNSPVGMKLIVVEHNFDASYFASEISATDADNKKIEEINKFLKDFLKDNSKWSSSLDGNTHTIIVPIEEKEYEANYIINYALSDLALNDADRPENKYVTYDKTNPNVPSYKFSSNGNSLIKAIVNKLSFGIFFNCDVKLDINTKDSISGLWKAELYIEPVGEKFQEQQFSIKGKTGMDNWDFAENNGSENSFSFNINNNGLDEFRGKIKINIYDNSGNVYRNYENVSVVDGTITVGESTYDNIEQYEKPEYHSEISDISITPTTNPASTETTPSVFVADEYLQDASNTLEDKIMDMTGKNVPLFNTKSVSFDLVVKDSSSGIRDINYKVIDVNSNNEIEKYSKLTNFDESTVNGDVVNNGWNIIYDEQTKLPIEAKTVLNISENINDIVILVELTDNAGNKSYDYYQFGVDTIKPVISAVFSETPQNSKYFSKERNLVVTVRDRDFNKSGKTLIFTYKYQGQDKVFTVNANEFVPVDDTPIYNDNKAYTYTIKQFGANGEYNDFAFEVSDRANNTTMDDSKIISGDAVDDFFYDNIAPVYSIVSDVYSSVANTKFYQDRRVITISVKDRYPVTKKNYSDIVGSYSSNASVIFTDNEDGKQYHTDNRTLTYVFTFETSTSIDCQLLLKSINDLAGNAVGSVPTIANGNSFTVDGKTPSTFTATISENGKSGQNVLNQNDYKVFVGDDLSLTITCSDDNLSLANISNTQLTCRALDSKKGVVPIDDFVVTKTSSSRTALTYSISNLDYDGFYSMDFTVTDDSGKQSSTQNVKFAVCRNGALFSADDISRIEKIPAVSSKQISNNVFFSLYSTSFNTETKLHISSDSLQFTGRDLVEGIDYTVSVNNNLSTDGCYVFIYTLLEQAFYSNESGLILDGLYTITATPITTSENGNKSEKSQSYSFTANIDATDPTIPGVIVNYKPAYSKENKELEISSDEKYRLFTNSAKLEFVLDDGNSSGVNENTIVVSFSNGTDISTWSVEEGTIVYSDGKYIVENISCNDCANGGTISIKAKDIAGNELNEGNGFEFNLNLDNNFWIYMVCAGFSVIALAVIIILAVKAKKKASEED